MATIPKKVLIFDSGLGGLGIFKAIQQQYPFCELIYCSDNEAFPYGTKSENEVIDRVSQVLLQLDQAMKPDIVVIACNTASTVALPKVRSFIKAPVVGVVPAIKPAAAIAKSLSIGLLATPGTVNRAYTQSLIKQFAADFNWIKIGTSELVQLAEAKMYGNIIPQGAIAKIVAPFSKYTSAELDTVVLACTHFPLVKQELKQALPNITHWIDSTEGIANRVGFWLHELGQHEGDDLNIIKDHQIVFTKKLENETGITALMQQYHLKQITTLKC